MAGAGSKIVSDRTKRRTEKKAQAKAFKKLRKSKKTSTALKAIRELAESSQKPGFIGFESICAVRPINIDMPAETNFNGFYYLAECIVGRANEERKYIPKTGEGFNRQMIAIYLAKCFAAYLIRCGMWKTDLDDIPSMNSLFVPSFIAVIFQSFAKFKDGITGGEIRLIDPNFPTNLFAMSGSEGTQNFGVWTSNGAGNEPIFGSGLALVYSSLTPSVASSISRKIGDAFPEKVPIEEIATYTTSLGSLLSVNGTSVKPVSAFTSHLALVRSTLPLLSVKSSNTSFDLQTHTHAIGWLLQDCPYSPSATLNSLARSLGIDPYRFSINYTIINWSTITELVLAWLVRNRSLVANMNGDAAWNVYVNSLIYFTTSAMSRTSWVSRTQSGSVPCYITAPMRALYLFPALLKALGQPYVADDSVQIPYWGLNNGNTSCLINLFQRGALLTPDMNTSLLPGTIINGSVSNSLVIGGFVPFLVTAYNVMPIAILDSIAEYIAGQIGSLKTQAAILPLDDPMCPCWTQRAISTNNFIVSTTLGALMELSWTDCKTIATPICVGRLHCLCATSAGTFTMPSSGAYSRFYSELDENGGQGISVAVVAGFRDNNFDEMNAAMKNQDPSTALLGQFKNKLLDTVATKDGIISPENVIKLVRAAQQVGFIPEHLSTSAIDNLNLNGEWNLSHLISVGASLLGAYGPSALRVFRDFGRPIHIRREL